jgi:thiol-disulfide isomerase/thioredoxin
MKKFFLGLLTLLLSAGAALSQNQTIESKDHNIQFKVNGLGENDTLIVASYLYDSHKVIDSVVLDKNGRGEIRGSGLLAAGIHIVLLPSHYYVEMVIPGDDQDFYFEFDTTLDIHGQIFKGSLDNEAFLKYNQMTQVKGEGISKLNAKLKDPNTSEEDKKKLKAQRKILDDEVVDFRTQLIGEYQGTFIAKVWKALQEVDIPEELDSDTADAKFNYFRDHFWDNYDLGEDGMVRTPFFTKRVQYYFENMFLQQPDTIIEAIDDLTMRAEKAGSNDIFHYIVWWSTRHYEESKLMCMDKVLHHMAKNYYCAGRCDWADEAMVKKMCDHSAKIEGILCDKIAPDLLMYDTSFRIPYQLHRIEAPITVLVFWDIHCGHCKKEIPKLLEFYDSMASRGVVVYAVYTQGDYEGWKKYINENKLNWLNVMDPYQKTNFRDKYNIISTPQLYILDKDKRIRFKLLPADSVGGVVEYLLKEQEEKDKEKVKP